MNNPKSIALGWTVLIVGAAGSYYYAKQEINARRLEQARKGHRGPAKEWHERLDETPAVPTTSHSKIAGAGNNQLSSYKPSVITMYPGNTTGYIPSVYLKRNNIATITVVDLQGRNLTAVQGANEIVGVLKKRPSVTQITLSQNALGDEGLQIILQYLTHNSASLSVTSLNLNSCKLGDAALEQLGSYIRNHRTLQNLSLQDASLLSHDYLYDYILYYFSQNAFKGSPDVVSHFTQCLNASSVSKLDLGRNPRAGDSFLANFLRHLHAPELEHLNLSAMNLTPASHDILMDYVSSNASRALRIFECNGNRLTRPFADALIHCLWTGNYWLKHIQLHGNLLNSMILPGEVPAPVSSTIPPDPQTNGMESLMKPWPACEKDMEYALHRNRLAGDFAASAAVQLLPYARIIVLQLGTSERGFTPAQSSIVPPLPSSLPFELKALILNELAPSLSLKQCHRIVQYAAGGFANAATSRQAFLKTVQCDIFEPNSMDDVLRALSNITTGRLVIPHGNDLPTLVTFR